MNILLLATIASVNLFGFSFDQLGQELGCMISSTSSLCREKVGNHQIDAAEQRQPDPKNQCLAVEPEFQHYYDWDSKIKYEAIEKITQSGYLHRDELVTLAGSPPTCRIEGSVWFTLEDGSQLQSLIYGWVIQDDPSRMFLVAVHPAHGDYMGSFDYIPAIADWRQISFNEFDPAGEPLTHKL